MIRLTIKEKNDVISKNFFYTCKKRFCTDDDHKRYHKIKDHFHYTGKYREAAHNICNLRHKIPKDTPVLFQNGSIHNFHFNMLD